MAEAVLPSGLIWGSNFSEVTSERSSGFKLHTLTPSAAPAAMAAPRAVVSGMDGFTVSAQAQTHTDMFRKLNETL